MQDLGKKFVPHFDLPESYADARRLANAEIQHSRSKAVDESLDLFKGTTPDERRRIAYALDTGTPTGDKRLDALVDGQKARFEAQAAREVEAGVLDPERIKEDYVSYIWGPRTSGTGKAAATSAKNPHAQERTLKSLKQAEFLGAETDIAKIAAKRQAIGDKAVITARLIRSVTANPEFAAAADDAPEGWRALTKLP